MPSSPTPALTRSPDALLATSTRNGLIECRYYGSVVVLGPTGDVLFDVGSATDAVYGRSSNKPLQAVAMLRAGVTLDDRQLALATASHSGSREHLDVVMSTLRAAGLTEAALRNVAARPLGAPEALEFARSGEKPSALTMNCSGKHAAMLATCVKNGWDTLSYLDPTNPLQALVTEVVEELAGETSTTIGVDGCGAPAHALSLRGLARAFSRIMRGDDRSAEGRVVAAIRRHPDLVGGRGRDVTRLLRAEPTWIAKDGADGVFAAALPDGTAVAVKISDGSAVVRVPVLLGALVAAGVGVDGEAESLMSVMVTGGGQPVGELRSVLPGLQR